MTGEDLFRKNQQFSTEFELYLLEHPEIEEQIPDNAMIVLVPEYDRELAEKKYSTVQSEQGARSVGRLCEGSKIKGLKNRGPYPSGSVEG